MYHCQVVLAEKPLISEETDLIEPTLLDELIGHISSLASVYHKPPSAFVEGRVPVRKITMSRDTDVAPDPHMLVHLHIISISLF